MWWAFKRLNQINFIGFHGAVEKYHQNWLQFELFLKANYEYKIMQPFWSIRFTSNISSAHQHLSFMIRWHDRCQSIFSLPPSNHTATFISGWHDRSQIIFSLQPSNATYHWMVSLISNSYFWIILVIFPSFPVFTIIFKSVPGGFRIHFARSKSITSAIRNVSNRLHSNKRYTTVWETK